MTATMASTAASTTVFDMCPILDRQFGAGTDQSDNGYDEQGTLSTASPGIQYDITVNAFNISEPAMSEVYQEHNSIDDVTFAISRIFTPLFCGFGIIGNILNIVVLTRRRMQSGSDSSSERAAFMGLIALAVSDLCYCTSAFPKAFIETQAIVFRPEDPKLYYYMYESYILNSFSKISTWLTVIMAVSRFVAICHPLHARLFVHAKGTAAAIAMAFLLWFLLELPECWTYAMITEICPRNTYIMTDSGPFLKNIRLKIAFQYIMFTLGFVVPVCILAFCNIQLIRALRASARMRQECRVHGGRQQPGNRITPTLIAIVLMFIFLMTPSEIINFMIDVLEIKSGKHETLILAITNLMNTINFSVNFVLYCVVNVHFRSTLINLLCCRSNKKRKFAPAYSAITSNTNFPTEENML